MMESVPGAVATGSQPDVMAAPWRAADGVTPHRLCCPWQARGLYRPLTQKQNPAAINDRTASWHRFVSSVYRASEPAWQWHGRSNPLRALLRRQDRELRRRSSYQSFSARDRAAIFVCQWAAAAPAARQSCVRTWRHRDSRIHADARSLLQLQLWLRRGLRADA